jgi:hypothetical protein
VASFIRLRLWPRLLIHKIAVGKREAVAFKYILKYICSSLPSLYNGWVMRLFMHNKMNKATNKWYKMDDVLEFLNSKCIGFM